MNELQFKIRGMDCAEEIAILKRAVGPVAGGEDNLRFDLMNGRMGVDVCCGADATSISRAVNATGMRAIPWEEFAAGNAQESFWSRHGRTLACAVSGAALILGFVVHALIDGVLAALGADEASYPIPVLATYALATVCGAWFVLPKAWYSARTLRPDMNLLMTVAVAGAILLGEWMEAAAVAFLFSAALLLESWSVGRARRAIESLMDLSPTLARIRCPHDGDIEEKPVEDVQIGATALVRPGEKIPLDGELSMGTTSVNEAPITGESIPVEKALGDPLYAGSINVDGAIEMRVTRTADDSTLARIVRMVQDARGRRAPVEQWVERFARIYTPVMMGLALVIAIIPPLVGLGTWREWTYNALVLLVIACPCALVISTPVSVVAGLAAAARNGVLIKGGRYLEQAARIRTFVFDKTGTLTTGEPETTDIVPLNGHTEHELLATATALESNSTHPIAVAIRRAAKQQNLSPGEARDFSLLEGRGARGTVSNTTFWIGSHRLMREQGVDTSDIDARATEMADSGATIIAIGTDRHVCGLIGVADSVRPEAADMLRALHDLGIAETIMLTGDNAQTAKAVARLTGIGSYEAELLPGDKLSRVEDLDREHGPLAMVGDGVNDAPALAAASLGIAMGAAGTDAAIETADIALMSDDLSKLPWLVRHARRTLTVIRQNIAFALGLKLLFILLALFGISTLWMAIAADMGASLLVIANGLRLLRT